MYFRQTIGEQKNTIKTFITFHNLHNLHSRKYGLVAEILTRMEESLTAVFNTTHLNDTNNVKKMTRLWLIIMDQSQLVMAIVGLIANIATSITLMKNDQVKLFFFISRIFTQVSLLGFLSPENCNLVDSENYKSNKVAHFIS